MFDMKKVGDQIALLRKEKGLTQDKLAESLSVSSQAVSKWENGHTLPETSLLPLLAKQLDCSIDTILMPSELQILDASFTDGFTGYNVTNRLNKLIDNNKIDILVTEQTIRQIADSERLWFLIVKYKNNEGISYSCTKQGDSMSINSESNGLAAFQNGLNIIDAYYGNKECSYRVMNKIEHYKFFQWGKYSVNHETFPSNPATSKPEYLSVLYMNDGGLHIAVCEEGESLVYTIDRRNLYREPFTSERKVIEGVEALQWGTGMDCSWAGALTVALKAMGQDTTYEKVMGVSGACYRLAFSHPRWDYSSVDGLVAYDYSTPAYKAFGYKPIFAERVDKKYREDERNNIINSLNINKPVLAINLRVAPEWGIITGYQDGGKTFLCRTYYDKEVIDKELGGVDQYLKADNWPFIITHFGCKTTPPSDKENLMNSLRIMIDCNNVPEKRRCGYYMGYKAYEIWGADLRNEDLFANADDNTYWRYSSVNHFCMMALVDARRCAYKYLADSADLFTGRDKDIVLEVSDQYRRIYEMADGVYKDLRDLCPSQASEARKLWTKEIREAQADMFVNAVDLEKQAEKLAKEFLEGK